MIGPISAVGRLDYKRVSVARVNREEKRKESLGESFVLYDENRAMLSRFAVKQTSFKGYNGDVQPLKKLFWIVSGKNAVYEDIWTKQHLYQVGIKKWVNASPSELLKRTPEQVIQSLCTIIKPNNQLPGIPPYIPTPNRGDKWGRMANYIEINPRAIAKYDGDRVSEGLMNTMKLLPAIPASSAAFVNCVILSQLYPTFGSDGTKNASSLYHTNLHAGISRTLTCDGLYGKMGADEQVKAFNDMAHLMGLKTGFRLPLSEGQLQMNGKPFNWYNHEKAYIDACCWGIELGFDAIYFDSAKHICDGNGYCGIGVLPNKDQMAYMLYQIRNKTGRDDISFIGEKCDNRQMFKEMGLTAGTDWGKADNFESVRGEARNQAQSREYAAGPEVSNDNDYGQAGFGQRLNRINSCLFGFDEVWQKLPSYMQMTDIFPLAFGLNTHDLMMNVRQTSGSRAWTECERHYDGVFSNSYEANEYRNNVYHIFENLLKKYG